MRSLARRLASIFAPALLTAALGCGEEAPSPTEPEPSQELAGAQVAGLSFRQISAGHSHTCGVTPDGRAYCWGYNFFGQLGDGTAANRTTPVRVAGALRFRHVSAGTSHTCGVTQSDLAYCWGAGYTGALGDGTTVDTRRKPVRVAGGLRFLQVVAANHHSCGVTLENRAYCWGSNSFGEIGDGTRDIVRLTPVRAAAGLRLRNVDAALLHTCGVTLHDGAYCWGLNSNNELGGGPPGGNSLTPVRVTGGIEFRRIVTGFGHTCGVTPENRAYCWGANNFAQLGNGTTASQATLVRVAGTLRFRQVGAAGQHHTCGVTPDDRAFCWGSNRDGQLGDGTGIQRLRPAPVAGGLRFRQVSARYHHTCGVTVDDVAYCWGSNNEGQLGDGTTTTRLSPVAVALPAP